LSSHERFHYRSLGELLSAIEKLGLSIPLAEETVHLAEPLLIGGKSIPNRIVAQPMEGADGTAEGKPGDLTYRRYRRVGAGGIGLYWFEAVAVVHEGKGNPGQLLLIKDNLRELKTLLDSALQEAENRYGAEGKPYTVLQLTHSGRYSRPGAEPAPIIVARNPYLDGKLTGDFRVPSDEELEELEDRFADAGEMAEEIGFDAVDIKACHGYLISELLSAHTREGRYGGSLENRARFLLNIVDKTQARTGADLAVGVRLNAYDGIPYPYGWGVHKESQYHYDLSEPASLLKMLRAKGVFLINITAGVPHYLPHIPRPYDTGPHVPPEQALQGVGRMLNLSREIKSAVPDLTVVASGFSYLREFGAHCAAGGIREGWFDLAGFGRQTLAYPDFPRDIMTKGTMERRKCCITCGKCSEILRSGGTTGCVVKDAEVYLPIYKQVSKGNNR
jgi:2,4-dienoyl-CoA reductase-like NADH-dependent reductase (Old Yellow Enzyme family)